MEKYLSGEAFLQAPPLILYEVANALRYHRFITLDPNDVYKAVEALAKLGIITSLGSRGWREALKISFRHGLSLYDSVYVAMATTKGGVLVTSDKKLVAKLPPTLSKKAILVNQLTS